MVKTGEAAAEYRLLFDSHPLPLWVFDADTLRFLAVNDACVNRYGYSRDEFLSLGLRDLVRCPDVDRAIAPDTPGAGAIGWRHRTQAGAVLEADVEVIATTFRGRDARLIVATERAEHRADMNALRERESLLQGIIANIPIGVFWKDRASIYLGCNDRVAADWGLRSTSEVVGLTDFELAPVPDEASRWRAADRTVMEAGKPLLGVEEARTLPDGTAAVLLTSRVPLRAHDGATVGVLGVYQDITERKKLEEQLSQAQKMEALGRLSGGVAHDFNNLLTVIHGGAQLLASVPPESPDAPQLIRDIVEATERATGLTRQLLAFSRRQPGNVETLDLNAVVTGCLKALTKLLGARIEVQLRLSATPVAIRADRGQMEQILQNLASNARDAMPNGGTLTIGTGVSGLPCRSGAAGRSAELVVADTGAGMSADVQSQLFEPFFTTKEPGVGMGLGLATVRAILEQSGGSVEVDSAPGRGSRFACRLPLSDLPPPNLPTNSGVIAAAERIGRGRTVLLVEDEDRTRKLARFILDSQNFRVVVASDAESALPLVASHGDIQLLLADVVLPGMDGRHLATLVRQVLPEVRVVLMSGHGVEKERAEEVPGAVFLPKPFNPAELARAVTRAFATA